MNRTLKTLLLWLLMAVLPLNAVAAAMGMSCSAVHDRARQAASVDAVERQASDHSAHHAAGHEATAAQPGVATDTGDQSEHSTCSACSAFCVGAVAPPPAVIPAPSTNGSEIVVMSPAPWVAGFVPDGHKRPPRHLSA